MTTSIHKLYVTEMLKASKYNAASGKVDWRQRSQPDRMHKYLDSVLNNVEFITLV